MARRVLRAREYTEKCIDACVFGSCACCSGRCRESLPAKVGRLSGFRRDEQFFWVYSHEARLHPCAWAMMYLILSAAASEGGRQRGDQAEAGGFSGGDALGVAGRLSSTSSSFPTKTLGGVEDDWVTSDDMVSHGFTRRLLDRRPVRGGEGGGEGRWMPSERGQRGHHLP